MTEQSEHLSNAQIENYGNQSSGAGPDADQRDENQRVDAHLADCPSCRSRLLDFHRTHFALLADSKLADPQLTTASTPDCPSEDALRQLAAGLCSDALATTLTHHAATCDHCGPLLRTYTEDFSDDFSPEEQAVLANLQSSSASWQKNTARQMLTAAGVSAADTSAGAATAPSIDEKSSERQPSANLGRKPFFWKWVLVPATAAICALVAFGIWYSLRDTPEKVEKLLAQAYTEQRKVEMRFPNAKHADFNQKRSGDGESRLNSPQSLNKATDKIFKQLEKAPDDPKWLILSARLDLLDWGYKPALSTLDKISDPQVIESPEFLMTRSLALYEKSEVLKESQGYFEAVNLLAKALQKTPDNPVLLFNQAIACEKVHSYECAKGDWERFLAVEKDANWSAEAHKHLDAVNEKKSLAP